MLPGYIPRLPAGVVPVSLSFVSEASNAANLSSYTFAGMAIGAAAANRYIIAVIETRDEGQTVFDLGAVTIGGVAGTRPDPASVISVSGDDRIDIVYALVPTGTTATVVVGMSEAVSSCGVTLFRATGMKVPSHDQSSAAGNWGDAAVLDVPQGGIAIVCQGYAGAVDRQGAAAWVGPVTEQTNVKIECGGSDVYYTTASMVAAVEQTITATNGYGEAPGAATSAMTNGVSFAPA